MSVNEITTKWKKFVFELLNNLQLLKHVPGEKVIQQNTAVLDELEAMIESSEMFFIISGDYKVQSAMFEMKNKFKDLADEIVEKPKIAPKMLK